MPPKKRMLLILLFLLVFLCLLHDLFFYFYPRQGYTRQFLFPAGPRVYFHYANPWKSSWTHRPLSHVQLFSFRILNDEYASDGLHVFHWGLSMEGIDPRSFEVLKQPYSKDRQGVYFTKYEGPNRPQTLSRLEADVKSFQAFGNFYAKDSNTVFYYSKKLAGVNPNDFSELGYGYAKDETHVYYFGRLMPEADAPTFHTLDKGPNRPYAQDQSGIYLNGVKLEADPATYDYPAFYYTRPVY